MFKNYYRFKTFFSLTILFLLIFLVPISAEAFEEFSRDPLSSIEERLSIEQDSKKDFSYKKQFDLYPEVEGKAVKKSGDEFSFSIDQKYLKKNPDSILRINYVSKGLFDSINLPEATLEVTLPDKSKEIVRLSFPQYYFSDLSPGKYSFKVNGIGKDYDYKFDFDLVDWFYNSGQAYISSIYDQEKLEKFLKQGEKTIITSNKEAIDFFGVETEIVSKTDSNDIVLEALFEHQDKVEIFPDQSMADIYPTELGSLVVVDDYLSSNGKKSTIILISPDLTRLDNSTLANIITSIKNHFELKNRLNTLYWILGLVVVVILLVYLGYRRKAKVKDVFLKIVGRLNFLKERYRSVLGKVVIIAIIFIILSILTRIVFGFDADFLDRVINKINIILGTESILDLILGLLIFFVLVEVCLYYQELKDFLKKFAKNNSGSLLLLFFFLFVFELYNLFFKLWPEANIYLVILGITIFTWLVLAVDLEQITLDRWLEKTFKLLIVLALAGLLLKVAFVTEPIWHQNWQKTFSLSVEEGELKKDNSFNIKKTNRNFNIKDELTNITYLNLSLQPELILKKPDEIRINSEIESSYPVYFKSNNINYLLHYPGLSDYRKALTSDGLSLYLNNKVDNKLDGVDEIEEAINSLPDSLTLELQSDAIKKTQDLEEVVDSRVNLSSFYKDNLSVDNSQMSETNLNIELRNFQFYSYFKDEIKLSIYKRDLNMKLGSDNAYLVIYDSNNEIVDIVDFEDDNRRIGTKGRLDRIDFQKDIENEGVFNFMIYDFSGKDIFLKKIQANSNKIVFSDFPQDRIELNNFYQQDQRSILFSADKKYYFNPFKKEILKPGNQADILVYSEIESFDPQELKTKSQLDFSLRAEEENFSLKNLEIIYEYF